MRSSSSSAVRLSPRRWRSVGSVVGVVLSDGIVGLQVVGPDVEVAEPRSVGQGEPERGLESAPSPAGFEDVGDGAGAEGVSLEGVVDGGGQLLRPVVVEQREQPGGVGS